MDWSDYKEDITILTPDEKEGIEKEASAVADIQQEKFLNPAQLEKLAGIFQKDILPAMKAHEKEVENNPELKSAIEKQEKRQEVRLVFRHMMAEVEEAIDKPGTPFADKLKNYIDELEEIVNPPSNQI